MDTIWLKHYHRCTRTLSEKSKKLDIELRSKAIRETVYEEGERVLVCDSLEDFERGRKRSAPWIGPYIMVKKLLNISYIIESVVGAKTARVHVNRLRHFRDENIETSKPVGVV